MDITKKWFDGDAPVNATYATDTTTFSVANAELVFTGKLRTADYNGWKVNLVDPSGNKKALVITVDEVAKEVNVSLATGDTGLITSTAKSVKEAIEAHEVASKIINVEYAEDNDGTGIVAEFAGVLANGADGTVCQDINVIVKDDKTGQMYINILPNSRHDANWRKLNLVAY